MGQANPMDLEEMIESAAPQKVTDEVVTPDVEQMSDETQTSETENPITED